MLNLAVDSYNVCRLLIDYQSLKTINHGIKLITHCWIYIHTILSR
jgi:hypothetical protein